MKALQNKKCIIFDFNGVLIDDEWLHFELTKDIAKEHGIIVDRKLYDEKLIGFDDKECFTFLGLTKATDLIALKHKRYLEEMNQTDLVFPVAKKVIPDLAAQYYLGINSGALKNEIDAVLHQQQWQSLFEFVISAESAQKSKPDPAGYLCAWKKCTESKLAAKKEDCIVVEDTVSGIRSAHAAGFEVIALATSLDKKILQKEKPIAVISSLEELL
jgi:beta-phosphoglucomutase